MEQVPLSGPMNWTYCTRLVTFWEDDNFFLLQSVCYVDYWIVILLLIYLMMEWNLFVRTRGKPRRWGRETMIDSTHFSPWIVNTISPNGGSFLQSGRSCQKQTFWATGGGGVQCRSGYIRQLNTVQMSASLTASCAVFLSTYICTVASIKLVCRWGTNYILEQIFFKSASFFQAHWSLMLIPSRSKIFSHAATERARHHGNFSLTNFFTFFGNKIITYYRFISKEMLNK